MDTLKYYVSSTIMTNYPLVVTNDNIAIWSLKAQIISHIGQMRKNWLKSSGTVRNSLNFFSSWSSLYK